MGTSQSSSGMRQKAVGRRQEAGGRRQKAEIKAIHEIYENRKKLRQAATGRRGPKRRQVGALQGVELAYSAVDLRVR
jgi:hypothetical protein